MDSASGDVIQLTKGGYTIEQSLIIDKTLTIRTDEGTEAHIVNASDEDPLFSMQPEGTLILENLYLSGNGSQPMMATLKKNMSSAFNTTVVNSKIDHFSSAHS